MLRSSVLSCRSALSLARVASVIPHTGAILSRPSSSVFLTATASLTPSSCHSSSVAQSQRAFSTASTPSDADLQTWNNFNSAGNRFLAEGQHEKASLMFMNAMREKAVQNTVYQYLSLSNLGISFRHLGRFDESRSVLMQSIHALKNYPTIHDGMIGNLYREAGLACESLNKLDEAEGLFNHSLHYYSQHLLAKEHGWSSEAQMDTTAKRQAQGEKAKLLLETAATHYTLALLIHKSATQAQQAVDAASTSSATASPDSSNTTTSSTSNPKKHVGVHMRLREAERHYVDALKLMRAVYGSKVENRASLLLAPVLSSMGTMYVELGELEKAGSMWMEAMDIYKQHQDQRLLPLLDAYLQLLKKQDPLFEQMLNTQMKDTDPEEQK